MKTFSIPLQGLFGMSKGSSHVSHLDQQVAPLIFELSRVDLTVTTSFTTDNTDEIFNNNDSNRDCV